MSAFVKIETCQICDSSVTPTSITSIDGFNKESYLEYSKKKYDGLIDDWINIIKVEIIHCVKCDHYWYREQPGQSMLNEMYASNINLRPASKGIDRSATSKIKNEISKLMWLIKKPAPLFLDYGSGSGKWAKVAVDVGFTVTAYEPSKERSFEKNEQSYTLVHSTDSLQHLLFDVINIEQVLEHVSKPVELLKEVRKYCAPGAVVRITVPNILRCNEADKIWEEWPYNGSRTHTMAPFQHLQGFTPNSLRSVILKAGFKPINGLRIWLRYPKEMIRQLLGIWLPRLGQTFILARVK